MARYEDNFGYHDVVDDEDAAFYTHLVQNSEAKRCVRCKKEVLLLPERDMCARCAEALEFGGE